MRCAAKLARSSGFSVATLLAVFAAPPAASAAAGSAVTVTKTVTTTATDPNTPVLVSDQNVPPRGTG